MTAPAPPPYVRIGKDEYRKADAVIYDEDRNYHLYVVGMTGSGKSTFAELIALQDLRHGHGVCFIDPKGQHAPDLLHYVPESRVKDTYYLEPYENPIPISLMDMHDNTESKFIAGDLNAIFRKIGDTTTDTSSWGVAMQSILEFSMLSIRQLPVNALGRPITILDLVPLLTDDDWRTQKILPHCNADTRAYWNSHQWKDERKHTPALLRRITDFRTSDILKALFTNEPKINIAQIVAEGKILIVNLGKVLSFTDKQIIGTIIITKIQQAIMRRALIPESEWKLFLLFVDEFQDYTASPLDRILRQCRSFNLGLTLFHQALKQGGIDEATRNAILGINTAVIFKPESPDVPTLATALGDPDYAGSLRSMKLHDHYAYFRSAHSGVHKLKAYRRPPKSESHKDEILARMRKLRIEPPCDTPQPCLTEEHGNSAPASDRAETINTTQNRPKPSSHRPKN